MDSSTVMNGFKTDAEYGYQISLKDDRNYQHGHQLGFSSDDTDVDVLRKIFDSYVDTTSVESMCRFASYKLEFSVTFIDTICLILSDKLQAMNMEFAELDAQEEDISHRMSKPYLSGKTIQTDEKIKIYNEYESVLRRRRDLKDTMTALRILYENMEKSRNFILGMNRRIYTPKSEKYKDDPDFRIDSKLRLAGESL